MMQRKLRESKQFASYPTSIITRIETKKVPGVQPGTITFLPHFHYNKDWNKVY